MGTRSHTQKMYPSANVETRRAFQPHQFAVQTSVNTASQPKQTAVDLQTKLDRAKGFGHNLSRVQVPPNSPIQRQVPTTQRKLYLQPSVVDEEQERDEEASRMQMKSDREQDSLLAHLAMPDLTPSNTVSRRSITNINHLCVKESAMSNQEHVQKKPLATTPAPRLRNGFETRGFTVQTKLDQVSHQHSDLKTQLSRATRFGHNLNQMSAHTSSPAMAALQTKSLATGQRNPAIQREEAPEEEEPEQMKSAHTIQREEAPEEEEPEQMKSVKTAQPSIQRKPIQKSTSPSLGNSMPGGVRAKMEKSFGTSFSDVSIHTESAQAKSIGALAYTQGSNVHFAPGQYNPHSRSGQSLLGHELTHVVQQRAGRVPVPQQSKGAPTGLLPK